MLWQEARMQRFACTALIVLFVIGSLFAQEKARPKLRVSCTADKPLYAASDTVNLTVTLENGGPSDVFIYRTVEWGWAGISFSLIDASGNTVRPREQHMPPPPPPPVDKSQLVGLAPGYFYGTHFDFDMSRFALKPGVYVIEVSYQSIIPKDASFGLPTLTVADGAFLSNKVQVEIR
jgi:hypothetical protein